MILGLAALMVASSAPSGVWIYVGSTRSGQRVTVDASSIIGNGQTVSAWFRLYNPNEIGTQVPADLLVMNCKSMTLSQTEQRKFDAEGQVIEVQRNGFHAQKSMPVVGGTPMAVAYLGLCTPRINYILAEAEEVAKLRR